MSWNDKMAAEAIRMADEAKEDRRFGSAPEVWEDGWYPGRVLDVYEKVTRNGDDAWVVELGLLDPAKDRKKTMTKWLVWGASGETSRRIAMEQIGKMLKAAGKTNPADCAGADLVVKLAMPRTKTTERDDGRIWINDNDVRTFRKLRKKDRQEPAVKDPTEGQDDDDDIPY